MARQGQNPLKWMQTVCRPKPITATTVVFMPMLDGYWKDALKVLELCLWSMRESTSIPFDLMVLDNGSCQEVQTALLDYHRKGWIQFLILSQENLGKVGAWNLLFTSAPGEIVTFCDSDVYFMRDWLEESKRILEAFPEAGMVTAQPIAGGDLAITRNGTAILKTNAALARQGLLIPETYLRTHLQALGAPPGEYERRMQNRNDLLIARDSVKAYATASHFQFATRKQVLKKLFPVAAELPLGADLQFDNEMLDLGFWRLSTEKYLAHHMGNRLPDLKGEIPWPFEPSPEPRGQSRTAVAASHAKGRIGNKHLRSLLKRINSLTWHLLYE